MTKDTHTNRRYKDYLEKRKQQGIEMQIAEADEIIHAIDKVDSRQAFKRVQAKIQKSNRKLHFLNNFTRVAAVLFIPLLVTSIFLYSRLNDQDFNQEFATQTISNPSGVRSELVLPDSSKVWLNAESSISYTIPFNRSTRDVKLVGEAFFEVKRDKHKPFIVESGQVNVKVLGTRFNYKAFPEDSIMEVVLEEGKVKLSSKGADSEKGIIMKPGERAIVNKTTKHTTVSHGNVENFIGWHEGKLILDQSTLQEVAKRLERWYGVEVKIIDPDIRNYRISTTFENESLNQILSMLELALPIKTTLIPGTVDQVTHQTSKEKVLIARKN